jgi:hypothetical protein
MKDFFKYLLAVESSMIMVLLFCGLGFFVWFGHVDFHATIEVSGLMMGAGVLSAIFIYFILVPILNKIFKL